MANKIALDKFEEMNALSELASSNFNQVFEKTFIQTIADKAFDDSKKYIDFKNQPNYNQNIYDLRTKDVGDIFDAVAIDELSQKLADLVAIDASEGLDAFTNAASDAACKADDLAAAIAPTSPDDAKKTQQDLKEASAEFEAMDKSQLSDEIIRCANKLIATIAQIDKFGDKEALIDPINQFCDKVAGLDKAKEADIEGLKPKQEDEDEAKKARKKQLKDEEEEELAEKKRLAKEEAEKLKLEQQAKQLQEEELAAQNRLAEEEAEKLKLEQQAKKANEEKLAAQKRLAEEEAEKLKLEQQAKKLQEEQLEKKKRLDELNAHNASSKDIKKAKQDLDNVEKNLDDVEKKVIDQNNLVNTAKKIVDEKVAVEEETVKEVTAQNNVVNAAKKAIKAHAGGAKGRDITIHISYLPKDSKNKDEKSEDPIFTVKNGLIATGTLAGLVGAIYYFTIKSKPSQATDTTDDTAKE
ncbi:MAG: hypothetical protein AAF380_02665 [Bacteroidota bacterium]